MAKDKKIFHSAGMSDYVIDNPDNQVFRDNRNAYMKWRDFKSSESVNGVAVVVGFMLVAIFGASMISDTVSMMVHEKFNIMPFFDFFIIPVALLFAHRATKNRAKFPFDIPPHLLDKGVKVDPDKQGWFVLGNSVKSGAIATINKALLLTHAMIFGTTGSGKSETLFTFINNALMQGSGALMVDGKADPGLHQNVTTLCRRLGRDIDLLTLSYIKGSIDIRKTRTPVRRSNTMNIMAKGGASTCAELMISLMSESSGDNAIFTKRAEAFVKAYMSIMTFLRDSGRKQPFMGEFADEVASLQALVKLARDETIPESARKPLKNYLATTHETLLTSIKNAGAPISPDAVKQHSFISMQLIEPLGLMGDDYGHIFNVCEYEIDPYDVLVNRRILITLIPVLEKSEQSVQALGKIILASVKILLSQIMGGSLLTGDTHDITGKRPTNAFTPFPAIFDEAGYYMAKGIAAVPAQARSLGLGFIFAGQDKPAFDKLIDTETKSILGNTKVKACGAVEEIEETGDLFVKRAGKAYIAETTGAKNQNSVSGNMIDEGSMNVKEVDRIDPRDLIDQDTGQFLFMCRDTFDFVQVMYAFTGINKVEYTQVHDFLPVPHFHEDKIKKLIELERRHIRIFEELIKNPVQKDDLSISPIKPASSEADVIAMMCEAQSMRQKVMQSISFNDISGLDVGNPEDGSPPSFADMMKKEAGIPDAEDNVDDVHHDAPDSFNIFNLMDEHSIQGPIDELSKEVAAVTGDSTKESNEAIEEMITDSAEATGYPKNVSHMTDPESKGSLLGKLLADIDSRITDDGSAKPKSSSASIMDMSSIDDDDGYDEDDDDEVL